MKKKIVIINHGKQDFMIKEGMKVAQLVLKPTYNVKICKVDYINNVINFRLLEQKCLDYMHKV